MRNSVITHSPCGLAERQSGQRKLLAMRLVDMEMAAHGWSLRELYRTLDEPGDNPLRTAQARLDNAVRTAYAMPAKADPLAFLLALNLTLAAKEKAGEPITPPGLPLPATDRSAFLTEDSIRVAEQAFSSPRVSGW